MCVFKVTANVKAKIGAVLSAPATLDVTVIFLVYLAKNLHVDHLFPSPIFIWGFFSMTVSGFAHSELFAHLGEIPPSAEPRLGGTSAIAVLPWGRAEGGGWVSGGQEDLRCGCSASDGCSTADPDHSAPNYSAGGEAFSAGGSGGEGARLHS